MNLADEYSEDEWGQIREEFSRIKGMYLFS